MVKVKVRLNVRTLSLLLSRQSGVHYQEKSSGTCVPLGQGLSQFELWSAPRHPVTVRVRTL